MVITKTAPIWANIISDTIPITSGNIVPPNNPIIINPDTSFCLLGLCSNAWEKIMENTFEFPKPINATQA